MSERIRLYAVGSPNVFKVVILLEELGLEYELEAVDVAGGSQYAPEFLAMNPFAKVPVLIDPRRGAPLFESGAILVWLAEQAGRFLPAKEPARSEVVQWLMAQMGSVGPMLGQLNHFDLVLGGDQPYPTARYRAQAKTIYRVLDDRLAGHDWLAGGDYSIADMATQPWARYLERHGFDPADYPALVRWREAIAARPAVMRADERARELAEATSAMLREASDAGLDQFFGRTDDVPSADFSAVRKM